MEQYIDISKYKELTRFLQHRVKSMQSSAKSSAKNDLSNTNQDSWGKYRPPITTINFSDIIEDQTIYDRTNGRIDSTFSSNVMDQPDINPDSVSVDDILKNSILHEIQDLSQSRHCTPSVLMNESQLPYNKYSVVKFPPPYNESFRPAEEMQEQLKKDEKDWDCEYAEIPSVSQSTSIVSNKGLLKAHGKLTNMSDFSGILSVTNSESTDSSIGRYFLNRCLDLKDILPTKTPTKHHHTPMSLIPSSDTQLPKVSASQSFSNIDTANYKDRDENVHQPLASLSVIASHLEENDLESPQTFLSKLYSKRSEALNKANAKLVECTANRREYISTEIQTKSTINGTINNHTQNEHENIDSINQFNLMMNSTKIDESNKENRWRNNNMADTQSYASFSSMHSSVVSPIKDNSPPTRGGNGAGAAIPVENPYVNKRFRSPTPPFSTPAEKPTKYSSPNKEELLSSQKRIANNKNCNNNRLSQHHSKSPVEAPLSDVSSMLNNLHLSPPNKHNNQLQPTLQNVRRCASELKSTTENLEIDGQRRQYAIDIRSPDHMKLSLPSYGLRGSHHDVAAAGAVALDKRCNSQCSTHSEFTQNDGKFPLKASTSELVWECVKLRKSVSKSFVIKNTSEKKLNLKIGVSGPGFQIASHMDTHSLLLYGNECRTINIIFCPTIIGKAIGKVTFRPTKNWPEEIERSVYLWAYGGSTVLQLQGIERGPVGSSFLKMGETSHFVSTTLERTFSIYNKGPLNGVATVFVKPKTNQCINENQITIEPNKCVICPDRTATICVTYKLRRKDTERLKDKACEVLTVGTLEVIFGSEPNRQRIASMLTRHAPTVPASYKQLEFLVNDFPVAHTECFNDYRENIENVPDLFGCFRTAEIALTINRTNLDETRNADFTCIDDSVFFRTLVETPKSKSSASDNRNVAVHGEGWQSKLFAQPKSLVLDPQTNARKTITIQNASNHLHTFQVETNLKDFLNISMQTGKISAHDALTIDIELKKNLHIPALSGAFSIYYESGSIHIPINVQPIPYSFMT